MSSQTKGVVPMANRIEGSKAQTRPVQDRHQHPVTSTPGGLCATCDNRIGCDFPRTVTRVLNCEELDYPPSAPGPRNTDRSPVIRPVLTACSIMEDGGDKLVGLCRTCEHRFDCQFPKPADGVWNCDEFV